MNNKKFTVKIITFWFENLHHVHQNIYFLRKIHGYTKKNVFDTFWNRLLLFQFFKIPQDSRGNLIISINSCITTTSTIHFVKVNLFDSSNQRTLNIYLRNEYETLQSIFATDAPIVQEYWLVKSMTNNESEIHENFSQIQLQYTSLLFPFHYEGDMCNIFKLYFTT